MAPYRLISPPEGMGEPYKLFVGKDRDDGGVPMPEPPKRVEVEAEPRPVVAEPEPKIKEEKFTDLTVEDPHKGVSPPMRQLLTLRKLFPTGVPEQKQQKQFSEELDPELMKGFIDGPIIDNEDGTFDCIFHHPIYGDGPFRADPNDDVPYGRAAHAYIVKNLWNFSRAEKRRPENDG